jgi:hypothetical protein
MFRTAVIGLAAAAALTIGATAANAGVNVGINFGGPGVYLGPVYDPYPYPSSYDDDCYYVYKKKLVKVAPGVYKKKKVKVLQCY